jgi:hypothetical protein
MHTHARTRASKRARTHALTDAHARACAQSTHARAHEQVIDPLFEIEDDPAAPESSHTDRAYALLQELRAMDRMDEADEGASPPPPLVSSGKRRHSSLEMSSVQSILGKVSSLFALRQRASVISMLEGMLTSVGGDCAMADGAATPTTLVDFIEEEWRRDGLKLMRKLEIRDGLPETFGWKTADWSVCGKHCNRCKWPQRTHGMARTCAVGRRPDVCRSRRTGSVSTVWYRPADGLVRAQVAEHHMSTP